MTYRSKNPFDANDYSNFAFKKSELLEVLQAIDSSFNFNNDQKIQKYCEEYNNDYTSDYPVNFENNDIIDPPLFYLNETFTLIEASCILSGDNPISMKRCFHDTNFDQNYPSFNEAYNFINAAVWAGKFPDDGIPSALLKTYLQSKGKIITGFNDQMSETSNNEFPQKEEKYENIIFSLELDIAIEKNKVEQLEKQLQEKDAEIAHLQDQLQSKEKELLRLSETQTSEQESKLHPRAENNVSKLILVLAEMAKIDVSVPYGNYQSIKIQAELLDIDKFPSDENIAGWLKKASSFKNPN
ncbi:hypothetical protein [Acinetobacter sp. ANC 5502]